MSKKIIAVFAAMLITFGTAALSGCGSTENSTAVVATSSPVVAEEAATTAEATVETTADTAAHTTAPVTTAPTTKKADNKDKKTASSKASSVVSKPNANQQSSKNNGRTGGNTNSSSNNTGGNTSSSQVAPVAKGDLIYNGGGVSIGDSMSSALAVLGNANSVSTDTSCEDGGADNTYYYNGFTVTAHLSGGSEVVTAIILESSSIATDKGVKVGDPVSAAKSIYGNGYSEMGAMGFDYHLGGNKHLTFYSEDGSTISSIEFTLSE